MSEIDDSNCSTGPLNGSFDLGDMDDASKLIQRIAKGENCLIELTMLYANSRLALATPTEGKEREEKCAADPNFCKVAFCNWPRCNYAPPTPAPGKQGEGT